jgi:hypothetical protein
LRPGAQPDDRCSVDDAALRLPQKRQRRPRHLEKAAHVDGENAVPFLQGKRFQILRLPRGGGAGVVDEDIEAAEALLDALEHRSHARLVADVAAQQKRLCAERLRFAGRFARRGFARAVVQRDIEAGTGERESSAAADAGGGARDQGCPLGRQRNSCYKDRMNMFMF